MRRIQHCTEAIYFKLNLYLNWQFHFEWEKEVPFVRWSEAEGTNFTPLKSKPTYLQYIHNGVKAISKSILQDKVQSQFSDIKFSDTLWFSDYFTKTVFQFTK